MKISTAWRGPWFCRHAIASCHAACFFAAAVALADDGFWEKVGGGSWGASGNWDSGEIAAGADNTAYFGLLADASGNATVTLDGARTIGNLYFSDQSGADPWVLNAGSGGTLTLDATLDLPSITVALANQRVTINPVLAGNSGLEKLGGGMLLLQGKNAYTGPTTVSGGVLLVNGQIGSDAVNIEGGWLGGTGTITGPVVVQAGGTLAPGNSLGTLTVSNSLTLLPGSTTQIEVVAATSARDSVQGLASVNYGGLLSVVNLSGSAPVLGQSFPIFSAANAAGNFSGITPATPGIGLRWRFDPASGVLTVVSATSQPRIASVVLAGTNIVWRATNGPPGATVYVLGSTNVDLSVTNWARLATNAFDMSGNFTFTNALSVGATQRFYLISVPVP